MTTAPSDWEHPWRMLAAALRMLWRLGTEDAQGRRAARRFVVLYLGLVTVLVGLGSAFLLMALGVLRALFLAAPFYPRVAYGLRYLGWQPPEEPWAATPSRWRTLHTALWVFLSSAAVLIGLAVLLSRGFCAQNWLCRLGLWP